MKKVSVLAVLILMGFLVPSFAAEVSFHGDMNNRFMLYTNHYDWFRFEQKGSLDDGNVEDNFAEIKYRFWTEVGSDDGNLKGVYAVEIGGIHFGKPGGLGKATGGSYSGDSVNIETRWAYTDFQIPGIDQKARFRLGLQPFTVSKYLWSETAMGAMFNGGLDMFDYQLAWMRTYEFKNEEEDNDSDDVDNFLGRFTVKPMDNLKVGLFGLYQSGDPDTGPGEYGEFTPESYLVKTFANTVELDIWNFGIDGSFSQGLGAGKLFLNWDAIMQTGEINKATYSTRLSSVSGDFDLNGYFLHADLGYKTDKMKLTYTFWYTSGDDDPTDSDFDGFIATDLDITDSIVLFEGSYADDDGFSERHYLLDKGFIMNKLAFEYQATEKLRTGVAGLYMMTAEDVEYADNRNVLQSNDSIGIEVDAFISYMLYKNVEVAFNAGYLFADDALDYFETEEIRDGEADENIFLSSFRVRYNF
ncbi:MAG: hypothetical protein V2I97_11455 [Desulfococcaceae bacterium]|jgi:hypothetical protein|nr:hypothetical protein [Desulfococcaceae bacterium]